MKGLIPQPFHILFFLPSRKSNIRFQSPHFLCYLSRYVKNDITGKVTTCHQNRNGTEKVFYQAR